MKTLPTRGWKILHTTWCQNSIQIPRAYPRTISIELFLISVNIENEFYLCQLRELPNDRKLNEHNFGFFNAKIPENNLPNN